MSRPTKKHELYLLVISFSIQYALLYTKQYLVSGVFTSQANRKREGEDDPSDSED